MAIPPSTAAWGYPASCTDTAWKAAKTDGVRDKWNTELGAALRAAKTAFDRIHPDMLDLATYRRKNGQTLTLKQLDQLKTNAQQHMTQIVKSAINALEKAKSLAATAAINPVLSKQTRDKADDIADDLGVWVRRLKAIDYDDYDNSKTLAKGLLDGIFANYDEALRKALRDGAQFVTDVRATPTPDTFNQGIQTAARDVTQLLGNIPKLQANGYALKQLPAPHLVDAMEDWAQGNADVAANSTAAQVLLAVTAYENALKEVRKWRM
jgi:hypothetical protein